MFPDDKPHRANKNHQVLSLLFPLAIPFLYEEATVQRIIQDIPLGIGQPHTSNHQITHGHIDHNIESVSSMTGSPKSALEDGEVKGGNGSFDLCCKTVHGNFRSKIERCICRSQSPWSISAGHIY